MSETREKQQRVEEHCTKKKEENAAQRIRGAEECAKNEGEEHCTENRG
jgi:hypothetical protein